MTVTCGFDNSNCELNCTMTGCNQTTSDGICDSNCDFIECGYDFGDCGICMPNCTSTLYYNLVCDDECNDPLCNCDNFSCVSYK